MPVYTLERRQLVRMALPECWKFFSDPRNLAQITPPAMNFRLQHEVPSAVYPGMMISYKVTPLLGISIRWLTEITHVRAPEYFCDEQRRGPYRLWHHEHSFSRVSDQETEVHDLIHYAPPLGPCGAVLNRLVVRPQLERIFDFRRDVLARR
ncbi:MAG: SRPBCC family protein [Verrucomicrobiota bacterium]